MEKNNNYEHTSLSVLLNLTEAKLKNCQTQKSLNTKVAKIVLFQKKKFGCVTDLIKRDPFLAMLTIWVL